MLSIKKVSILTLIKIVGAVLSILFYLQQIDAFGIKREIECYFIAVSLMLTILAFTQVGHLSSIFLPIYHEQLKAHGEREANKSFWIVLNWLVIFSLAIIGLALIGSNFLVELMAPGYSDSAKQLINSVFQILCFSIVIQLPNKMFSILLNAIDVFNRPELIGLIRTCAGIVVLFFGYEQYGIWSLVIGFYAGRVFVFLLYLILLKKKGISYKGVFSSKTFNPISFFKNLFKIYPLVFSKRLYNFVLIASASFLPAGVFAIYKYVESLFMRTGGIILVPTVNIFFTNYSVAQNNEPHKLKPLIIKAFKINLTISLFIILIVLSFGEDIVSFIWFEKIPEQLHKFAYFILSFTFASLFFQAIGGIYFKVLFVIKKTGLLFFSWTIAHLIASLYAYLVIKNFDSNGLISIFFVSTLLTNSLFYLFIKEERPFFHAPFKDLFFPKLLLIFISSAFIGYWVNQIEMPLDYSQRVSYFWSLTAKTALLSICAFVLFISLYSKNALFKKA